MKKVIMIHGWGGSPESDWFPWLKKELELRGFKTIIPAMPDTMNPKIEAWVNRIREAAGKLDKDTYFVGHSIGCQSIMRYLQTLDDNIKIGGIVFVAPWLNLTDETWDEEYTREIANPWLKTLIDFKKIKSKTENIITIFSDNDPYVPLADSKLFKEKLNAKIIIEKGKGHFAGEDGQFELLIVLNSILEMTK